jgi:hypothetical protein
MESGIGGMDGEYKCFAIKWRLKETVKQVLQVRICAHHICICQLCRG